MLQRKFKHGRRGDTDPLCLNYDGSTARRGHEDPRFQNHSKRDRTNSGMGFYARQTRITHEQITTLGTAQLGACVCGLAFGFKTEKRRKYVKVGNNPTQPLTAGSLWASFPVISPVLSHSPRGTEKRQSPCRIRGGVDRDEPCLFMKRRGSQIRHCRHPSSLATSHSQTTSWAANCYTATFFLLCFRYRHRWWKPVHNCPGTKNWRSDLPLKSSKLTLPGLYLHANY